MSNIINEFLCSSAKRRLSVKVRTGLRLDLASTSYESVELSKREAGRCSVNLPQEIKGCKHIVDS